MMQMEQSKQGQQPTMEDRVARLEISLQELAAIVMRGKKIDDKWYLPVE